MKKAEYHLICFVYLFCGLNTKSRFSRRDNLKRTGIDTNFIFSLKIIGTVVAAVVVVVVERVVVVDQTVVVGIVVDRMEEAGHRMVVVGIGAVRKAVGVPSAVDRTFVVDHKMVVDIQGIVVGILVVVEIAVDTVVVEIVVDLELVAVGRRQR